MKSIASKLAILLVHFCRGRVYRFVGDRSLKWNRSHQLFQSTQSVRIKSARNRKKRKAHSTSTCADDCFGRYIRFLTHDAFSGNGSGSAKTFSRSSHWRNYFFDFTHLACVASDVFNLQEF